MLLFLKKYFQITPYEIKKIHLENSHKSFRFVVYKIFSTKKALQRMFVCDKIWLTYIRETFFKGFVFYALNPNSESHHHLKISRYPNLKTAKNKVFAILEVIHITRKCFSTKLYGVWKYSSSSFKSFEEVIYYSPFWNFNFRSKINTSTNLWIVIINLSS